MVRTNRANRRNVVLSLVLSLALATSPAAAFGEATQDVTDQVEESALSTPVEETEEGVETQEEALAEGSDSTDEPEVVTDEQELPEEVVDPGPAEESPEDPIVEDEQDPAIESDDLAEEVEAEEEPALEAQDAPKVPAAPSNALNVKPGTYLLQAVLASGMVVETPSSPTNGSAIQIHTYGKGAHQKWIVERYESTNWYYLRSTVNKTLVLGLNGTAAAGTKLGAVTAPEDLTLVLWAFVPLSDGSVRLVSAAGTSFAAGVSGTAKTNGTALELAATKNTVRQRFLLINAVPAVPAGKKGLEGAYLFVDTNSGYVAEIKGGSKASTAEFRIANKTKKANQQIYLEPVDGGGYYIAWIVGTRKVLAVEDSSILSGSDVRQYKYNGSEVQKWAPVEVGGGFELVNKATGLHLKAKGAKKGSDLEGAATGSVFRLDRIALLSSGIVEIKPHASSAVSLMVARSSTKNGAGIVLKNDTDVLSQRFELVSAGDTDVWRVRTASSGGWLSVRSGKLQQFGKGKTKASSANTWRVVFRGGWYGLVLKSNPSKALNLTGSKATKGTRLGVATSNGSEAQHFTFTEANLLREGNHFIKNKGGKYLTVKDSSSLPGTNVMTNQKTAGWYLGEQFTIECGDGYVRLRNTYNGCYLTATGRKNGSNVVIKASSSSDAQKWKPVIADGGYVSFKGVGAYSKRVLNVSKNSRKNRANVNLAKQKGTRGQLWKPLKSSFKVESYIKTAIRRANYDYSSTGYYLVVDLSHTRAMILKGSNGNWSLHRTYLCSCGKPGTPTITGSYTVGSRGQSFTDGDHTCYYWTEIRGDYLFHSVLYRANTMDILDGRLGFHISMGCVRLDIEAAKYIYDVVPSGTKILIY